MWNLLQVDEKRAVINEFIAERLFSTGMIICGNIIDMTKVEGIVVFTGIGTELINRLICIAKK